MEEPLLPPGGANDNRGPAVRVVLNPSALDRFLRGPPYYFYDDVPVPHERLLVGADRPMLPSQKERLLRGDEGGGEDDLAMFGHLWMLFCARLAQTKARNHPRDGRRRHFLWCGLWFGAVVFIVMQIIVANDAEIEQLLGFVAVGILTLLPLTIRFSDVTERQAQELVDEMAPLFAEEEFHVDLIASSSHTPMYVRFERASSAAISSSSPLQESMLKFQEQARRDHEDVLIDQRQADLRENGLMPARICGIGVESLREWEFAIRTCTIIVGFVFVVCTVFTFLGYWHLLLDMSGEWRRTRRIKRRAVVEYADDLDYTP